MLRNKRFFPDFKKLPEGYKVDPVYYHANNNKESDIRRGEFSVRFTWCQIGEIVDDALIGFPKHRILVKDASGDTFPIAFHNDTADNMLTIFPPSVFRDIFGVNLIGQWNLLKTGSTVCVRYARRHLFVDTDFGLPVENLDFVKVIPVSLKGLLSLSDQQLEKREKFLCWKCGKPAKSSCGRCKIADYCEKQCQIADWPNHKTVCRILPDYFDLIDFDTAEIQSEQHEHSGVKKFSRPFII